MSTKTIVKTVSATEARRIALAAQGFGRANRSRPGLPALSRLIERLGAVQIDSVNVLVRSQYLPAFARLGPYDRALLDRIAYGGSRRTFEYWGHESSLLPLALFPLFRWRMERARSGVGVWQYVAQVGLKRGDLVRRVRAEFEERGPLGASDFADGKSTGSWWSWTDTKRAVEFLFWCGEITPTTRRSSFERVYDLTERVIPRALLEKRVDDSSACRELALRAARALGVATESDIRDYYRLPVATARQAVGELVDAQLLTPVNVEGWKHPAYLDPHARVPRSMNGTALLSPFDSLVWDRKRMHRLFDYHYRIEIYTPAHKRLHGYYVLPYLVDEALVARVDLKADRRASSLLVQSVHFEQSVNERAVRARLRNDLAVMAEWLGLKGVSRGW